MADERYLLKAVRFAAKAHHGQLRSGTDHPYVVHPIEVAEILANHRITDPAILCAAILHDVLEDTDTTVEELSMAFGASVTAMVCTVSDDPALTKKEQREALLMKVDGMPLSAQMIKMADGISNVRGLNDECPAGWDRSLKLAFAKSCERVAARITRPGTTALKTTFAKVLAEARERLKKK